MARIETDPNYTVNTFSRATAATDPFKKEDVQGVALALSTHDHSAGKGLVLPLSAIPVLDASKLPPITTAMIADGTIATADLADGSVTTAKLAARAATFAHEATGISMSPTTTSTSGADIPDLSLTFNIPTTADLLITLWATLSETDTNNLIFLGVTINAGAVGKNLITQVGRNGGITAATLVMLVPAVASSTVTVKGRWWVNAGTVTAVNDARGLLVEERYR